MPAVTRIGPAALEAAIDLLDPAPYSDAIAVGAEIEPNILTRRFLIEDLSLYSSASQRKTMLEEGYPEKDYLRVFLRKFRDKNLNFPYKKVIKKKNTTLKK